MTKTMTINGVTYEYHHTAMARGYLCKSQNGLAEDYKGCYGEGKKIHRYTAETTLYHPVEYWIRRNYMLETVNLYILCCDIENVLVKYLENEQIYDIVSDLVCLVDNIMFNDLSCKELISKYRELKGLLNKSKQIADEIDNSKLWIELDNLWGRCVREQPLSGHF